MLTGLLVPRRFQHGGSKELEMKPPAYTVKKSEYLHPEAPASGSRLPRWLRKTGLDQPDTRRNFRLWPLRWIYGTRPRREVADLALASSSILHVGCESGWLTWEMSLSNPSAQIVAVEPRGSLVEWARSNFQERRPEARVEFLQQKLDDLQLGERKFDLLVLSFTARRASDARAMLERIVPHLKERARVFYYEGTEPTPLNLDRLSRWMYRRARFRGLLTDLWNQRRRLQGIYLDDAARAATRAPDFVEADFFDALQSRFDIVKHSRRRAFIDMVLSGLSVRSLWLSLPLYLAADRLLVASAYLEGCCRVAVGRLKDAAPGEAATGLQPPGSTLSPGP
jgi:hypothetical protein